MEVTGILTMNVGEREGVSQQNGQPWKVAEYLLVIPGQYERKIVFEVRDGLVGRIARFDSLIGKTVTVSFDVNARQYEGRWYNKIEAWGVMEYVPKTNTPTATPTTEQPQEPATNLFQ